MSLQEDIEVIFAEAQSLGGDGRTTKERLAACLMAREAKELIRLEQLNVERRENVFLRAQERRRSQARVKARREAMIANPQLAALLRAANANSARKSRTAKRKTRGIVKNRLTTTKQERKTMKAARQARYRSKLNKDKINARRALNQVCVGDGFILDSSMASARKSNAG